MIVVIMRLLFTMFEMIYIVQCVGVILTTEKRYIRVIFSIFVNIIAK